MKSVAPPGPTVPSSTNFLTNFTRLLKVTDSINGNSFSSPNPNMPGLNTTLSGGTLSNLNNPIEDSQGATYAYAQVQGGTSIPGGPVTSIQYNNSGAFGGSSSFTFDDTTQILFANRISNGTVTIGQNTISGLTDPVSGSQAATKNYVDNQASLTITSVNTIGSVTYNASDVINGLIYRDTQTIGTTIDSLPTAAQIVSTSGANVGTIIYFSIKNVNSDYTNIVKFNAGTGITKEGNPLIFSGYQCTCIMVVTNITPGFEAINMYILNSALTNTVNWGIEIGGFASVIETIRVTDGLYISSDILEISVPTPPNVPKLASLNVSGNVNTIDETTPQIVYLDEPQRYVGVFANTDIILAPFIYKSGGMDFYVMNLSTTPGADVTIDGITGLIPWTIDPNSNMTIPPGYTGWFMIYLTMGNYPLLATLTYAAVYTLGIFPNV